jgi:tetratricopeptide (TPR) repeat protein
VILARTIPAHALVELQRKKIFGFAQCQLLDTFLSDAIASCTSESHCRQLLLLTASRPAHVHLDNKWEPLMDWNKISRAGLLLAGSCLLYTLSACSVMPSEVVMKSAQGCLSNGRDPGQQAVSCDTAIRSRQYSGPRLAELYFMKGIHLQEDGKDAAAVLAFQMALRLRPRDAKIYYYRSLSLPKLGQYDEAQRDFESAHRLN